MGRDAGRTVLLVDLGKIGKKAMSRVCDLNEIGYIITVEDAGATGHLAAFREQGVTVELAPIEFE